MSNLSLGGGALQSMRAFVGRGAKVSAPITAICGIIADLSSTIGKFSFYIFIVALCSAIISGLLWFAHYRRNFAAAALDGKVDAAELAQLGERNVWSVLFAFSVIASVVMGGFVLAAKLTGNEDKGVIAGTIPGMDKVQESLFRMEKKIDVVQADTSAIRQDTSKITASLDDIAKRFDSLNATGGIIPNAKTPEEHYHNARVHELGGNFSAARNEYSQFLASNLDVIDPWQSFATMLKAQEGRAGALETLRYFGDKLQPRTVSYETTLALLDEGEARLTKLQTLATNHPEYGPLDWVISQEYSEAKRGEQTLADQRAEKEWLGKFREAQSAGKFDKYFLDKKEAQKWVESADARWAKLGTLPDNPVTLTAQQSNAGWGIVFGLADYKAKELFYRVDGRGEFQSSGVLPNKNPQTGLPMVNTFVPLPNLAPGEHAIDVRYTDKNGQTNGPYTLKFSTADEQIAQGKMMLNATAGSWLAFRDYEGKVLLYFTQLMSYRPLIKEVRYSLNSDALDKTFKFKPSDKMFEVGEELYLTVPNDTQFATVQVTYKDGTVSTPQKVMHTR